MVITFTVLLSPLVYLMTAPVLYNVTIISSCFLSDTPNEVKASQWDHSTHAEMAHNSLPITQAVQILLQQWEAIKNPPGGCTVSKKRCRSLELVLASRFEDLKENLQKADTAIVATEVNTWASWTGGESLLEYPFQLSAYEIDKNIIPGGPPLCVVLSILPLLRACAHTHLFNGHINWSVTMNFIFLHSINFHSEMWRIFCKCNRIWIQICHVFI